MYRIELAPGEETVFRTIDELAVAVRNGLVTSRARIYHNASQKWLPIEFHPHYKHALQLPPIRPDVRTPVRADEPLNFAVAQAHEPVAPIAAPVPAARPVEAPAAVAFETEAVVAAGPSAPSMRVPRVVPSPVRGLPTIWSPETEPETGDAEITDPEVTDAEITYPVFARAEAPVVTQASTPTRSRRPLHLAGAAAVLGLGVYALMSVFSPSRGDAASARALADRPAMPQDSLHADATQPDAPRSAATRLDSEAATPPVATTRPAVAQAKPAGTGPRAPAPVAMTEPASSGFAPALESRAIVTTSSATVRAPAPKDSSIAPAPVALDLVVPELPGAETLVATPHPQGDSALKRILRAVNGGKDVPQRP